MLGRRGAQAWDLVSGWKVWPASEGCCLSFGCGEISATSHRLLRGTGFQSVDRPDTGKMLVPLASG